MISSELSVDETLNVNHGHNAKFKGKLKRNYYVAYLLYILYCYLGYTVVRKVLLCSNMSANKYIYGCAVFAVSLMINSTKQFPAFNFVWAFADGIRACPELHQLTESDPTKLLGHLYRFNDSLRCRNDRIPHPRDA
jgi:hypothetical protein